MAKKGPHVTRHKAGHRGGARRSNGPNGGRDLCACPAVTDGVIGATRLVTQPVDSGAVTRRAVMLRHQAQGWCALMAFSLAYLPAFASRPMAAGAMAMARIPRQRTGSSSGPGGGVWRGAGGSSRAGKSGKKGCCQ